MGSFIRALSLLNVAYQCNEAVFRPKNCLLVGVKVTVLLLNVHQVKTWWLYLTSGRRGKSFRLWSSSIWWSSLMKCFLLRNLLVEPGTTLRSHCSDLTLSNWKIKDKWDPSSFTASFYSSVVNTTRPCSGTSVFSVVLLGGGGHFPCPHLKVLPLNVSPV